MNVREAIREHARVLEKARVDSPRLECELLVAHVLGVPRTALYMDGDLEIPPASNQRLKKWVARRAQRVPLQHLLGTVSFCGLEMQVNRRVLIPRPETELLAEEAIRRLGEFKKPRALDLGTGSGCLAIAIAVANRAARVDALDVSARALAVARENARRHRVASRVRFLQADGRRAIPGRARFHCIVSNPPYIPTCEIASLQPEVRDHDPRLALDGGVDGLDFFHAIAERAPDRLWPGGKLLLEIGGGQVHSVRELLTSKNWRVEKILPDLGAIPRIVVASVNDS